MDPPRQASPCCRGRSVPPGSGVGAWLDLERHFPQATARRPRSRLPPPPPSSTVVRRRPRRSMDVRPCLTKSPTIRSLLSAGGALTNSIEPSVGVHLGVRIATATTSKHSPHPPTSGARRCSARLPTARVHGCAGYFWGCSDWGIDTLGGIVARKHQKPGPRRDPAREGPRLLIELARSQILTPGRRRVGRT